MNLDEFGPSLVRSFAHDEIRRMWIHMWGLVLLLVWGLIDAMQTHTTHHTSHIHKQLDPIRIDSFDQRLMIEVEGDTKTASLIIIS